MYIIELPLGSYDAVLTSSSYLLNSAKTLSITSCKENNSDYAPDITYKDNATYIDLRFSRVSTGGKGTLAIYNDSKSIRRDPTLSGFHDARTQIITGVGTNSIITIETQLDYNFGSNSCQIALGIAYSGSQVGWNSGNYLRYYAHYRTDWGLVQNVPPYDIARNGSSVPCQNGQIMKMIVNLGNGSTYWYNQGTMIMYYNLPIPDVNKTGLEFSVQISDEPYAVTILSVAISGN